jgi:AcrR family transcriptional regulator
LTGQLINSKAKIMPRPPTNHEARKAQIVEAALDCFARHGYEGATNKVIAEAAGMKSAALIYHYFPGKESLFQACLERVSAFDTMRSLLEEHQDDPPDVYLRRAGRT